MAAEVHRSVSSRPNSNFSSTSAPKALTTSEVGRIVNSNFKEGEVVKGNPPIIKATVESTTCPTKKKNHLVLKQKSGQKSPHQEESHRIPITKSCPRSSSLSRPNWILSHQTPSSDLQGSPPTKFIPSPRHLCLHRKVNSLLLSRKFSSTFSFLSLILRFLLGF